MGKPFKKTRFGKLLGGLGRVLVAGSVDFIPGAETLVRLVSKTPEDQESTNGTDLMRILMVLIIGGAIFGVITGKLTSEQLDGIIDSLSK